jgi:hypothetical protein
MHSGLGQVADILALLFSQEQVITLLLVLFLSANLSFSLGLNEKLSLQDTLKSLLRTLNCALSLGHIVKV